MLLYALRLVRRLDVADVLVEPPQPARSRRRSTPSPTSAAAASSARTWREQGRMMQKMNTFTDFIDCAEYLIKQQLHIEGPARHPGRQRRRAAGGRRRQHAAGPVQSGRRAGAVRRRHQHDARRVACRSRPANTSSGATRTRAGVRLHDEVLAVRQRHGAGLSGDAGARLAQRQPGAVLGRDEVRGQAAGDEDRHEPADAESNMGAGHGGASGRYDALRETAFTYAFMLWQMGLVPSATPESVKIGS